MSRFRYQGPIPPHIPNMSQYDKFQENYERSGTLFPKFQALQNYAFQIRNDLLSFYNDMNLHLQKIDDDPIDNLPDIRDFKCSVEFTNKTPWQNENGINSISFTNPICSCAPSWHNKTIALGSYSTLLLSDFENITENLIPSYGLPGPLAFSRVVSYHPSDRLLALSAAAPSLHLFDTELRRTLTTLNIHEEVITGINFTSCGTKMLSSSRDGVLNITDLIKSKVERQIHVNNCISSFIISKYDDYIALATKDSRILLFDNRTEGEVQNLDAHYGQVTTLATNNEGIIVSGGSDHCVRIWDIRDTISACGTIASNTTDIKYIQFMNNNQHIIYTTMQGHIKEYSLENTKIVKQRNITGHPLASYYHEDSNKFLITTEACDLHVFEW